MERYNPICSVQTSLRCLLVSILSAVSLSVFADESFVDFHDQIDLASRYGLEKDSPEVMRNIKKLEEEYEKGSPIAAWEIYILYWKGTAVTQNDDTAIEWLDRSSNGKYHRAFCSKGHRYLDGRGGHEINVDKSKQSFESALSLHDYCANPIAVKYYYGSEPYKRDYVKAHDLFLQGLSDGYDSDGYAEYYLGKIYEAGLGQTQNYKKAIRWFEKAAKKNNPDALLEIGYMYDVGNGVDIDKNTALEFYIRSAELGSLVAASNLAITYSVKRSDAFLCYVWASVAAANKERLNILLGDNTPDSVSIRNGCEENVDASRLSSAQSVADTVNSLYKDPSNHIRYELSSLDRHSSRPFPNKPPSFHLEKLDAEKLYASAASSVYSIKTATSLAFFPQGNIASGSGVAISSTQLLTNCHVVESAQNIAVIDIETDLWHLAKVVRHNVQTDMCVIETSTRANLNPIKTLRSVSDLSVGEVAFAIGDPKGFKSTISQGLISGVRELDGDQYIQTTASISPGSSGGALFDQFGNLIGITTFLIRDAQNINFAIPAERYWDHDIYDVGAFVPKNKTSKSDQQASNAKSDTQSEINEIQREIDRLERAIRASDRRNVAAIQTQLNIWRCNSGTADGIYGPKTRRALERLFYRNPAATIALESIKNSKGSWDFSDLSIVLSSYISYRCY